jgi:phosphonate transport system ATP-binding protein
VQGAELLIADEPIASLDPGSARRVMDILADMNRRDGITILVSLHQVQYALSYCPRTIALQAGKIVYDGPSDALTPELLCSVYGAEVSVLFAHGSEPGGAGPRHENGSGAATVFAPLIDSWGASHPARRDVASADRLTA